ncbi:MAG TPA: hypothetical protein VF801_11725 [Rhodocyclaceae bacterium]
MQSNTLIPDFYFSAFRSVVDVMNVYLGGLGRLQAYQIDAMQKMRADPSEVSRQIDQNGSIDHAEFARDQMERVARYWGGLYSTAYQNQIEVIKEAQSKALALTTDMRQRLESAPQGAEPMISAMRLVFDAAQSTCAAGMRATEEVERLTAAQAENAAQTAKSAGSRAKRAA